MHKKSFIYTNLCNILSNLQMQSSEEQFSRSIKKINHFVTLNHVLVSNTTLFNQFNP